jgi:soluble lytic murein transglycosylase-like protein
MADPTGTASRDRTGRAPARGVAALRRLLVFALLVQASAVASAELAVFTNGRVLKITSVEVEGDGARLVLEGGGVLTVPLTVVERIVDDELVPEPVALALPPTHPVVLFSEASEVPDTPYGELIYDTARHHDLSPDLVAAMVRAESAFDASAVSHKGARGLMQLMPATAVRFGVPPDSLFDPEQNLKAGVGYLKWLTERYPDAPALVLAAYNAGEGNVDRYSGVPPFRETREYIRRVYSFLGFEADPALTVTR